MKSESPPEVKASLTVEKIGGIEKSNVEIAPGVNLLEGRNATNRTSLLQSIMAALGSDEVTLKGNAEEGYVELQIGDQTFSRKLKRIEGETVFEGDPYLNNSEIADLFAFLTESNEARRTVARSEDLRNLIMRPVDTEKIENQITETEDRRDNLDEKIELLKERKKNLPELESKRSSINDKIKTKKGELETVQERMKSMESDVEKMEDQKKVYQNKLSELNNVSNELDSLERQIEEQQAQKKSLKNEKSNLKEERSNYPTSFEEISDLGQEIGKRQEKRRSIGSLLDRLQNIIQFNRDVVEDTNSELREALVPEEDPNVTEGLIGERDIVCWTCGSKVSRKKIEATIDDLRDLRQNKMEERKEITEELDDLRERKQEIEKRQRRREQIDQQLNRINDQIERKASRIEELRDECANKREEVNELEREVEEIEPDGNDNRIIDLSKRESELRITLERLREDLEKVEKEIEEIKTDVAEIPKLIEDRKSARKQLTNLRNRIEDLEKEAVEEFNEHIENLLDRLEYDNLNRIWIERKEAKVREGRQMIERNEFVIHVVRKDENGSVYEDTIDHLSQSEREVTGLVFALAGFLVHNVHEKVPFMLLDSLESIDSNRISDLIDYFADFVPYLVVALLPEDAQAVTDPDNRIREI